MLKFDEIGYWSEVKLEIVREYSQAYSRILTKQGGRGFQHFYIDAFAGAGQHLSKSSGDFVSGSPLVALNIEPKFSEYHLVELNPDKATHLEKLIGERSDVHIYRGDCNVILLRDVLPLIDYAQYRRALCLLDPYGLHLDWAVIEKAGHLKTVEIFLNFPVADMNRNVFWRNPVGVDQRDVARMNTFWGDDSWRTVVYTEEQGLFGPMIEKEDNETIALAFRDRLVENAGFKFVPKPLPMRNNQGAIVYYLFFASPNPVGQTIVGDIFAKFASRGMKGVD